MQAAIKTYAAGIKRAIFSSAKGGSFLSPFGVGATGFFAFKGLQAANRTMRKKGNLDIYRGLYVAPGQDVMSSGKRGIDAKIGGTAGLVQGLHSNRRRY